MNDYDVAIIGSGFVGSSFAHFLNNTFSVKTFDVLPQSFVLSNSNIPHDLIDITNFDSLKKIGNPKVVIHSAIIQIPKINDDKNLGYNVNVKGTQNIVDGCNLINCKIVFISTSAVFDGTKNEYFENDIPNPTSVYGMSKLQGELIIKNSR